LTEAIARPVQILHYIVDFLRGPSQIFGAPEMVYDAGQLIAREGELLRPRMNVGSMAMLAVSLVKARPRSKSGVYVPALAGPTIASSNRIRVSDFMIIDPGTFETLAAV